MRIDLVENKPKKVSLKKKVEGSSVLNKNFISLSSFSNKKKESFYRDFSLLIRSGVDFHKALELLIMQEKSKFTKAIYQDLLNQVVRGKSLFQAMENRKDFTNYETFSVKAGEEIRKLPEVLDELQKYFERKIKIKRQITSMLAYPCFVLTLTLGILYFMLNYVVPMFSNIFKQFGGELPLMTQYVVALSKRFNTIILVFAALIIAIYVAHYNFKKIDKYRYLTGTMALKIPVFGVNLKRIALTKFCQSMALLLTAKTSLTEALELSASLIQFYPLQEAIIQARSKVIKGMALNESLQPPLFDAKTRTMISIGEEINELDGMFEKLADQLNEEIEYATKTIGSIIEPLMILIIAIIVGFILIAMYYPMFSISKVIGN